MEISGIHLKGVSGKELAGISLVAAKVGWSGLTRQKIELARILIDKPVLDISMSEQGDVDILSALIADTGSQSDAKASEPDKSPGIDFWVREFKVNQAQIKVTAPEFNADLPELSVEVNGFKLADLSASAKVVLAGGHLELGDMDLALDSLMSRPALTRTKFQILISMPGCRVLDLMPKDLLQAFWVQ